MILSAANASDKACAAIMEQATNYLGLGLANLVNLFNPSVLVLDQRLQLAGQGLLDQVTKVVKRQALSYSTKDMKIVFGKLSSEASVLGAGSVSVGEAFRISCSQAAAVYDRVSPRPAAVRKSQVHRKYLVLLERSAYSTPEDQL